MDSFTLLLFVAVSQADLRYAMGVNYEKLGKEYKKSDSLCAGRTTGCTGDG